MLVFCCCFLVRTTEASRIVREKTCPYHWRIGLNHLPLVSSTRSQVRSFLAYSVPNSWLGFPQFFFSTRTVPCFSLLFLRPRSGREEPRQRPPPTHTGASGAVSARGGRGRGGRQGQGGRVVSPERHSVWPHCVPGAGLSRVPPMDAALSRTWDCEPARRADAPPRGGTEARRDGSRVSLSESTRRGVRPPTQARRAGGRQRVSALTASLSLGPPRAACATETRTRPGRQRWGSGTHDRPWDGISGGGSGRLALTRLGRRGSSQSRVGGHPGLSRRARAQRWRSN